MLEFDRLWSRVWQVACRDEEITDVGDFCEYLIGDQSILVVRSAPDTVRAFHNTCLHRGTRLADGAGRFPEGCIRCRYHAWRYDLDGKLVEVVDREEFDAIPDDAGLKAVRVEPLGRLRVDLSQCRCAAAARLPRAVAGAVGPVPPRAPPPPHLSVDRAAGQLEGRRRRLQRGLPRAGHPPAAPALDRRRQPRIRAAGDPRALRAAAQRRRQLRPSPRLGLTEGEYDEGEILEAFIAGLGGLFYKDEGALVEEIRASASTVRPC